jgi:hypothetical protein
MLRHLFLLFFLSPFCILGSNFEFSKDVNGWQGDFADYPVNEESFYELAWGWSSLPLPVLSQEGVELKKGLYLSGNNHSDDLFMFVKRKIEGLEPNRLYALSGSILLVSDIPASTVGIGGSPGESVFVKMGGYSEEPNKVDLDGYYHLNLDKGDQSGDGAHALTLGYLGNDAIDPDYPIFLPKTLSMTTPLVLKSNENGELWVFLGTDSGFEGITEFFIAEVAIQLDPV